jgi:hypothetical protein
MDQAGSGGGVARYRHYEGLTAVIARSVSDEAIQSLFWSGSLRYRSR